MRFESRNLAINRHRQVGARMRRNRSPDCETVRNKRGRRAASCFAFAEQSLDYRLDTGGCFPSVKSAEPGDRLKTRQLIVYIALCSENH
jgi:hypothetical protein